MTELFRTVPAPSDAGLNLLWPGLAQYAQHRVGAGVLFSVDAAVACAVFIWSPSGRFGAALAFLVITVWSILDANIAGRQRAE